MQSARTDKPIGVAYAYCSYLDHSSTALGLMARILSQLAQDGPSSVAVRIGEYLSRDESPTLTNVKELIHLAGEFYQHVFLVVDGLDEVLTRADADRELISNLQSFQDTFGANILLTLRNIPDILEEFPESDRLEIRASNEDVAILIDTELEHTRRFQGETGRTLKGEVKKAILLNTKGM